jgi:cation diffusion facilitator family transporter
MMQDRDKSAIRTIGWSIGLNLLLAVVKGAAGLLGNSYALIADAIESINDVFSSLLVYFGLKYASRPADENHPYGHGKIEPLITFLVVSILIGSAVFIGYQSIQHIMVPHKTPEFFTIYVLLGIILFKELSYQYVYKKGKDLESTSLKADAWHHRSDALTSVFALIGILIAIFMGPGYESADDWAALAASLLIIYNAYSIFRPALSEVMDEHVYDELIDKIRLSAKKVPGVLDTEKCFVRKTGMYYWIDLHAVVDGRISVNEGHRISHQLKDYLLAHYPEIKDVLIHIEPNDE